MKRLRLVGFLFCVMFLATISHAQKKVLPTTKLKNYVDQFNSLDTETIKNFVPNADAFKWLSANVPLFECPDSAIEKIYYYRWWTFRKHLVKTPDGYVFTEFITNVKWAGDYNTVSSAVGHHLYEGRWLRDPQYIKSYINFWLYDDPKEAKPHLHNFSSWLEDAVYHFYMVNPDKTFIGNILPALNKDYHQWETERQLPDGSFWQFDVRDAMEESISGSRKDKNVRPTINSYMYGNAVAMEKMAALTGVDSLKNKYAKKAADLKHVVQAQLWDDSAAFFEVKHPDGKFANAREELGFIPWYFNLPDDNAKYAAQWDQLNDQQGFQASWGITTAEKRHPQFRTHGTGHGCEWDGAVWPFATSQTLTGLANLLTGYSNHNNMSPKVFYDELHKYAMSHIRRGEPYLGEYQDEKNGSWLKGDNPRSSYYNHSTFCDLVISDLVGLKSRSDNILEMYPLIPTGQWDWFCLDNVNYHNHNITVLWDKTGARYHKGKGFSVYVDSKPVYRADELKHFTVKL